MGSTWAALPDWVAVAPTRVRRGASIALRWERPPALDHELRLVLLAHWTHTAKDAVAGSVTELELQAWEICDRVATRFDAGAATVTVPADAPYSYPGKLLGFFWGVTLTRVDAPRDACEGWRGLTVLP